MEAESGGFMYADSSFYLTSAKAPVKLSFVKFLTSTTFDTMKAVKSGGVFYVNYKLMTIYMNTPI